MLTTERTTTRKLMTAEEAAQLSTVNRRFELVKGVYVEMSPTSARHGKVANRLSYLINGFIAQHPLGEVTAAETGFLLARNPDVVRAADVAFIAKTRLPAGEVPEEGYWTLAPDLAVEVVSPNDKPDDVQEKVQDYLEAGTPMVWVVYPKTRSVMVYRSLRDIKILRAEDMLSGAPCIGPPSPYRFPF